MKQQRLIVTLMMVCLFALGAGKAEASIFIHEILADPPAIGGDANGDGVVSSSNDEFIELYNSSDQKVDISGWSIVDDMRQRHIFASDTWISPFGLWVVFGGGTPMLTGDVYSVASSGGLSLNNGGDRVSVFDAHGILVDDVLYGAEGGKDQSLVRVPERYQGDFALHTVLNADQPFSPGAFVTDDPVSHAVPEPVTCLSLAMGMGGLLLFRKNSRIS